MFPQPSCGYCVYQVAGPRPLKLGVVHLVQPGAGAGGEVWVACAALCGEVGGGSPRHRSRRLARIALGSLPHQAVHVEGQAA